MREKIFNIIINISALIIITLWVIGFCISLIKANKRIKENEEQQEQIKILEQQVIEQTAEKEVYMKMLELNSIEQN